MKIVPHHLILAAQDDRLRFWDLRVYLILQSWLDDTDYLPVRSSAVAGELSGGRAEKWREINVNRAMGRLAHLGYLARGPNLRSHNPLARRPLRTYRLQLPVPRISTVATAKAA